MLQGFRRLDIVASNRVLQHHKTPFTSVKSFRVLTSFLSTLKWICYNNFLCNIAFCINGRHDTQHNGIQHNDIQYNVFLRHSVQMTLTRSSPNAVCNMVSVIMLDVTFFMPSAIMLSVIMLKVVSPHNDLLNICI